MTGAITCWTLAAAAFLSICGLLIDLAWRKYSAYREKQAMRIRDEQLRKYCITPMFGTKERHR